MPQKKGKGKRSSKIHNTPPRPTVRIPADQRALGRYGYKSIWTGKELHRRAHRKELACLP